MQIDQAMNSDVLTVTPDRTLKQVAEAMAERRCGSAVVIDTEQPGPGIFTERDLLNAVAQGGSPNSEVVRDHLTAEGTFAEPSWSLDDAAQTMLRGGFRHLVVIDGGEAVGVVSMRDIVRRWAEERG